MEEKKPKKKEYKIGDQVIYRKPESFGISIGVVTQLYVSNYIEIDNEYLVQPHEILNLVTYKRRNLIT